MTEVLRECCPTVLSLVVLLTCLPLTANSESPQIADPVSALERKVQKLVDNSSLVLTGTHVETKFFKKAVTALVSMGGGSSLKTSSEVVTANVFEVVSVHKGAFNSPTIEVLQFGGMDFRASHWNPNYYFLKFNQKYLVFANFDEELIGAWRATNGSKGVFKVLHEDGEEYLQNTVPGPIWVTPDSWEYNYEDGDLVLEDENPKISLKRVKQMLRSEGPGE